jgi:uncharacterized lipoprotein
MKTNYGPVALLATMLLAAGCSQQTSEAPAQQAQSSQPAMQWKMQSYWQGGTLPQQLFEDSPSVSKSCPADGWRSKRSQSTR